MSDLKWELDAALAYKNKTSQSVALKSAVERILDILEADSTSRIVRIRTLRAITGYAICKVPIQVYRIGKTVADCFKYRNQNGMDSVLKALS